MARSESDITSDIQAGDDIQAIPETVGALLDTAAERFADRCLFDFFERGERLTFAQTRDRVHRLAGGLYRIGVRKGTHVAVMLPNIPAYPVTWLALATLGAVMVPVNNRYTARELTYVTGDAEAEFLIIHADYLGVLDQVDAAAFCVEEAGIVLVDGYRTGGSHRYEDLVARGDPEFVPAETVDRNDLLNIQYTSGTTGFPKGCMQTHRYWTVAGVAMGLQAGITVKRILCAQFFYYLDPQLFVVLALNQGSTVVFANMLRASKFMEWVRTHDIDFIFLFEPIFKQPENANDACNALQLACLFGFTPDNHAALEARFATKAREWYGMTEIGSGLYVPLDADHMVGSGSCGQVAPFRSVTIRDPETGKPVPQGEVGELWVGGDGIMVGYYNKPDANSEAFRDGWFRTGDLFRRDENGFHYIVGRVKDMIRRSAENIAAREVEAVLRTHPSIREAAVVAVPDDYRGEEVKAYIQLMDGMSSKDLPPQAVFEHCARELASFKIPRYVEYRPSFAYGPADRVEKHKLIAETDDLRLNSYDRLDGVWR